MDNMTQPDGQSWKHQKLDTLETYTLYSITYNPNDKTQAQNLPYKERLAKCRKAYDKVLSDCSLNGVYYYFKEEISIPECNTFPRYHLHGMIYFTSKEACLYFLLELQCLLSQFNTYSFKKIDDLPKWVSYITKQNLLGEITNIFSDQIPHLEYVYHNKMAPAVAKEISHKKSRRARKSTKTALDLKFNL